MVIQKYIRRCEQKKVATNYAKASVEQKRLLEQLDVELDTMRNMIQLPERAIRQALVREHEQEEKDLMEEVRQDVRDG